MKKELLIVRHGQTEYNREKRVQGSGIDSSLNETGREQSRLFYEAYRDQEIDLVVSSTLKRSMETIRPFVREQNIDWMQRKELNEIHWGEYEGSRYHEQLIKEYRNMIESWKRGDLDACLEGGESARALSDRLDRFIDELIEWDAQKILICSHGRTIRCLLCRLQSWPLQRMEEFEHSNTGLFKLIEEGDNFRLVQQNNTEHLARTRV